MNNHEQALIRRFERQMVAKAHIVCRKKDSSILTRVPHSPKKRTAASIPTPPFLLLQYLSKNQQGVFVGEKTAKTTRNRCVTSSQSPSCASLLVASAASASQQPASMSCWYMFPKSSRICLIGCTRTGGKDGGDTQRKAREKI